MPWRWMSIYYYYLSLLWAGGIYRTLESELERRLWDPILPRVKALVHLDVHLLVSCVARERLLVVVHLLRLFKPRLFSLVVGVLLPLLLLVRVLVVNLWEETTNLLPSDVSCCVHQSNLNILSRHRVASTRLGVVRPKNSRRLHHRKEQVTDRLVHYLVTLECP
ncbi:hypothetical protein [Yellowstone lake phycodnavirus 2]|uniref:hypothetical protein n=1 Tax=Yellowstone lake phycodnavirus 2 TaxID=1586714 RepID=UPI0006EB597E|nr:hypothetical protein AR678_gp021 [Yellowstone lake phycodnavirus 2]BAT22295.1 hypothetical protein [Yellowstone lake phycodnavirus 2]